jgi:hypothetical protein
MEKVLHSMASISQAKHFKRRRQSSYDRTGGNDDRIYIQPGETREFATMDRPGCIKHMWMTVSNDDFTIEHNVLRKAYLAFYWDGETNPSVLAPLGDFFGMGHAMSRNFVSAPCKCHRKRLGPEQFLADAISIGAVDDYQRVPIGPHLIFLCRL